MLEYFSSLDLFGWLEIAAVLVGLAYVVLEVLKSNAMWVLCILAALLNIAVYLHNAFSGMALLQVYYIATSVYGIIQWRKLDAAPAASGTAQEGEGELRIVRPSRKALLLSLAVAVALCALLWPLFSYVDHAAGSQPYRGQVLLDTSMSVLSMLAMYWVSRSYLENWYLWILVNAVSVAMFAAAGLWWMAALYGCYLVTAFIGLRHWRRNGVYFDEKEIK
ncbi:MAG: nicotinamide mononucleotide transporter [Bacteroidales bacterium]|nr:nicotinamide mononucleotide transporter [Bacteroidales bacterium]